MNAKLLYDAIFKLIFAILSLMILLSIVVWREGDESIADTDNRMEEVLLVSQQIKPDPEIAKGKLLFKNNCASCHNKNLKDKLIGPALEKVSDRWAAYPREDLYKWIRNSQSLIAEGHPRAKELWAAYKESMTPYPNLSDAEIELILKFCDQ